MIEFPVVPKTQTIVVSQDRCKVFEEIKDTETFFCPTELDNKVDLIGDEIKLLKEENEKLRMKATEHIELANHISKLLKKF